MGAGASSSPKHTDDAGHRELAARVMPALQLERAIDSGHMFDRQHQLVLHNLAVKTVGSPKRPSGFMRPGGGKALEAEEFARKRAGKVAKLKRVVMRDAAAERAAEVELAEAVRTPTLYVHDTMIPIGGEHLRVWLDCIQLEFHLNILRVSAVPPPAPSVALLRCLRLCRLCAFSGRPLTGVIRTAAAAALGHREWYRVRSSLPQLQGATALVSRNGQGAPRAAGDEARQGAALRSAQDQRAVECTLPRDGTIRAQPTAFHSLCVVVRHVSCAGRWRHWA